MCDKLAAAPPPHPAGGEGEKIEWRCVQEEDRSRGKVFQDLMFSSLSYSDLISNKFNKFSPSQVCFVVTGGSLPAFISTHKTFVLFPLPCLAEESRDKAALVAPGVQPQSTHLNC